jgi:hypothetical protein
LDDHAAAAAPGVSERLVTEIVKPLVRPADWREPAAATQWAGDDTFGTGAGADHRWPQAAFWNTALMFDG